MTLTIEIDSTGIVKEITGSVKRQAIIVLEKCENRCPHFWEEGSGLVSCIQPKEGMIGGYKRTEHDRKNLFRRCCLPLVRD